MESPWQYSTVHNGACKVIEEQTPLLDEDEALDHILYEDMEQESEQQPKVKQALHEIWMAPTREDAYQAFDVALATFSAKYPKAMECLKKDKEEMLAFYDFPATHWQHIRTANPIESTFATVRLRAAKTGGCVTRHSILSMVYKLGQSAQKKWRRLRGYRLPAEVIRGVQFKDGEKVDPVEGSGTDRLANA
ncbi:transposase [Desulfobulbus alkaliphilus]|uniref:transposase n=1 Tax=Desulfobulbus alkaliphilus TaxID=869814 RepID=UPI0019632057|nr:transposase [Desulfobulbus alkaliphilus]MBM9536289.1 transposase [Desulfobulbus alkaliphilus]